jgi:hypothetical protein
MEDTITRPRFDQLVCERCGFIHEPQDLEACVPVPADQLSAELEADLERP